MYAICTANTCWKKNFLILPQINLLLAWKAVNVVDVTILICYYSTYVAKGLIFLESTF